MHLSQLSLYFCKSVTYDALNLEHKRGQPLQQKERNTKRKVKNKLKQKQPRTEKHNLLLQDQPTNASGELLNLQF